MANDYLLVENKAIKVYIGEIGGRLDLVVSLQNTEVEIVTCAGNAWTQNSGLKVDDLVAMRHRLDEIINDLKVVDEQRIFAEKYYRGE